MAILEVWIVYYRKTEALDVKVPVSFTICLIYEFYQKCFNKVIYLITFN